MKIEQPVVLAVVVALSNRHVGLISLFLKVSAKGYASI
jgi:hypothetical protein